MWPGSWDSRSRTGRWVFSVWRPLQGGHGHGGNLSPSLEHRASLQPVCAPGAASGAGRAACPSAGCAATGRWGLKSWGPPFRSHKAVKTTALTFLHLSGKEAGVGKVCREVSGRSSSGLNDTPRTSVPFFQQHTREQPPGDLGKKGEEGPTLWPCLRVCFLFHPSRHFPVISFSCLNC